MISRDRVQIIHDNSIPTGNDVQLSPIIPDGEIWQVSKITFADKAINDGLSGGFQVDFGAGGSFEILQSAYLVGDTLVVNINRVFTGDGAKTFRFIRANNSAVPKEMFLMVEGFKRIGD